MFANPLFFGFLNVAIIAPLFIFIVNGIRSKDKQQNKAVSPMKEVVVLAIITFVVTAMSSYMVFKENIIAPTEDFSTGGAPF